MGRLPGQTPIGSRQIADIGDRLGGVRFYGTNQPASVADQELSAAEAILKKNQKPQRSAGSMPRLVTGKM